MASAWLKFLKEYYAKNKGTKTYKQAMVDGAKVYKAQKGKGKAPKGKAPSEKKKAPDRRRRRRVKRKQADPSE